MRRTRIVTCCAAALVATALAGCGANAAGGGSTGSNAVLSVGTLSQFVSPNPFNVRTITDYDVMQLTYPVLAQYNSAEQFVPDFAKSWSVSSNGLTWTFKLQSGAKWSDGQPMTASDAAWTINLFKKYEGGGAATFYSAVQYVTTATAPNSTTLVVNFSKPSSTVLAQFDIMPILPEHIWDKYSPGKDGASLLKVANKPPNAVSGGPYTMSSWNGTNFLLLKANPDFYGPKPQTKDVGIQYFTSEDGLLLALKNGQIDYGNGLLPGDVPVLKKDGLVVNAYPSTDILTLSVNDMPGSPAPVLRNLEVRKAIDLAINRAQIVKIAYPGGLPAESILEPANGQWYDSQIHSTYDPAQANKLLDDAGFSKGSNGVRTADGKPMAYTLIVGTDSGGAGARAAQIIQQNLSSIGISLTIRFLDPTTWSSTIFGQHNKYNEFDMALDGTTGIADPSANVSGVSCLNLGTFNVAGYCSPPLDKLYNEQQLAVDNGKRKQLLDEVQQYVYAHEASIQVVYVPTIDTHQKTWTGFGADPYGSLNILSKVTFDSIHHV